MQLDTTTRVSRCVQCSTAAGCARCDPNAGNGVVCLSCFDGKFLNGQNCEDCPSGCAKCITSTTCIMCSSGFVAVQAATLQTSEFTASQGLASAGDGPVSCVACTSPCATCRNSPTTCLSCVSGRVLSGNDCVFTNSIKV